jgi:hypothetical protein
MNSIINQLITQDFSLIYFLAQTSRNATATGGTSNLVSTIFGLAAYLFTAYCFMKIYDELGEFYPWFSFIPFLNMWIMYKAGDKSPWWTVGIFIPLVNLVAAVILLMAFVNIVQKLGKNPWLILLMIIPFVNFWVMYHFAFG